MAGKNRMQYKRIIVDSRHEYFDKTGMWFKEFPSDFRQVRFFSLLVVQKAPAEIKEINLLEQQISELIKNAMKHGNKKDPSKKVQVWTFFSVNYARVIVEDEGDGFQEIDDWNEFNQRRNQCFESQNYDELDKYFSYRSKNSTEDDGGNALFAAVEYWDGGVVFNEKKNAVAVHKDFRGKKRPGIKISNKTNS